MDKVTLMLGDCIERMKELPDASVDAIVTDPPYHLTSIVKRFGGKNAAPAQHGTDGAFARASRGFMGKTWDGGDIAFRTEVWEECLRVLKPGGHLLAFSGTRTYHRMAVAIEDAGFEIRDMLEWAYASGFPKSHNVSKGIDAKLRLGGSDTRRLRQTEQDTGGESYVLHGRNNGILGENKDWDRKVWVPATEDAKKWDGWGTALKPSHEPICLARKPLIGTIVENVLKHGTGALNIDGCRIGSNGGGGNCPGGDLCKCYDKNEIYGATGASSRRTEDIGRWPANILHDGSEEVINVFGANASFFFCPKAQKGDRDEGLEEFEEKPFAISGGANGKIAQGEQEYHTHKEAIGLNDIKPRRNTHATVKPVSVMRWLVRLITPPGGTVLDPFMGSGSTGKAAVQEGFGFIGIEMEEESFVIAEARIKDAHKQPGLDIGPEPVQQKSVQPAMELV